MNPMYPLTGVVDRHRCFHFDAGPDPDPDGYENEIHTRNLLQALHMLENRETIFTFIHSYASLRCFSFLIKGKCVMTKYFGQVS
jgi:hypothetical protein